jgi:prepilin-type processing-associated H-X9-DG protein
VYICPANTRPATVSGPVAGTDCPVSLLSYLGSAGTTSNNPVSTDGVLFSDSKIRLTDIADGTSNTLMVGERPCTGDLSYGWWPAAYGTGAGDGDCVLGARDIVLASVMGDLPTNIGLKAPTSPQTTAEIDGAHWWSFHPGGVNFLYADGTVHFVTYSADAILPQLSTRNGGEIFDLP